MTEGNAAFINGQNEHALEHFSRAIELHPTSVTALAARGLTYGLLKQWSQAISDCDEAIRIDDSSGMAYSARASVSLDKGDQAAALPDLNKAISLLAKPFDEYFRRGLVHGQQGNHAMALEDMDSAIELWPDEGARGRSSQVPLELSNAVYNRGVARMSMGDPKGAKIDFEESLRLTPGRTDAISNLQTL